VIFNREAWVDREIFWYLNFSPCSLSICGFEKDCAFKIGTDARYSKIATQFLGFIPKPGRRYGYFEFIIWHRSVYHYPIKAARAKYSDANRDKPREWFKSNPIHHQVLKTGPTIPPTFSCNSEYPVLKQGPTIQKISELICQYYKQRSQVPRFGDLKWEREYLLRLRPRIHLCHSRSYYRLWYHWTS
jgi:hypothetical protein